MVCDENRGSEITEKIAWRYVEKSILSLILQFPDVPFLKRPLIVWKSFSKAHSGIRAELKICDPVFAEKHSSWVVIITKTNAEWLPMSVR